MYINYSLHNIDVLSIIHVLVGHRKLKVSATVSKCDLKILKYTINTQSILGVTKI